MVAQSPMAAHKTMSSTTPSKPTGLRKLFGRKNSGKKTQPTSHQSSPHLRVASPPASMNSPNKNGTSFNSSNNINSSSSKRRGFFSRGGGKDASSSSSPSRARTPSLHMDPSSEENSNSSEENVQRQSKEHPHRKEAAPGTPPPPPQPHQRQQMHSNNDDEEVEEHIRSIRPIHDDSTRSSPSPRMVEALQPVREATRRSSRTEISSQEASAQLQQQHCKTRDGFCRRVDTYDGSVITVEGQAAYELGNYLGGGVAGVVYEGHRLLPVSEYPVRTGAIELPKPTVIDVKSNFTSPYEQPAAFDSRVNSLLNCVCLDRNTSPSEPPLAPLTPARDMFMTRDDGSLLTMDSYRETGSLAEELPPDSLALEAMENMVLIDAQDAPSRSKHMARAVVSEHSKNHHNFPSDASFTGAGFMEETVAIKILNPVGFRTLAPEVTQSAVVAREGAPLQSTSQHMEEQHVWWLVNPQSRNLRTLQRYTPETATPRGVEVDRGHSERGLRISLVAAYKDPVDNVLKELPLTRCIEIWGHVPFEASDQEFRDVMAAIDKVNQGYPPSPISPTSSLAGDSLVLQEGEKLKNSVPLAAKRTGIYRAASTPRKTVYCAELFAYIALPAVPSKYLKWLRQRRAATKEIRNMMLIGRHRNVVHLFEVLELIQDTKSTMFLILELVRGGELFDLISSNSAKITSRDCVPPGYTESETVMRKFFLELASGIQYCHLNNIAHRDLKPENLLVHNGEDGNCTLKIADFGLSAVFGSNGENVNDNDTIAVESYVSGPPVLKQQQSKGVGDGNSVTGFAASPPLSPIKQHVTKLLSVGNTALGFFTCGAVEDIINCSPRISDVDPSPLKRMTSVVGSPHYVAPEIISQQDKRSRKTNDAVALGSMGYDGTKADVWSAGVILYAMLFRSLPFGEDLLRCPRYQSYKKWYDEVIRGPRNRRSDLMSPLNPVITEAEDQDFLGPHWFFPSESSPESRDLIVYMLNPNPDLRPSIQLVLQHPWLLKRA